MHIYNQLGFNPDLGSPVDQRWLKVMRRQNAINAINTPVVTAVSQFAKGSGPDVKCEKTVTAMVGKTPNSVFYSTEVEIVVASVSAGKSSILTLRDFKKNERSGPMVDGGLNPSITLTQGGVRVFAQDPNNYNTHAFAADLNVLVDVVLLGIQGMGCQYGPLLTK